MRLYNHTWSAFTTVTPVINKTVTSPIPVDAKTLKLPANGEAAADFLVKMTKSPAVDLGNRLRVREAAGLVRGCGVRSELAMLHAIALTGWLS